MTEATVILAFVLVRALHRVGQRLNARWHR